MNRDQPPKKVYGNNRLKKNTLATNQISRPIQQTTSSSSNLVVIVSSWSPLILRGETHGNILYFRKVTTPKMQKRSLSMSVTRTIQNIKSILNLILHLSLHVW